MKQSKKGQVHFKLEATIQVKPTNYVASQNNFEATAPCGWVKYCIAM